MHSVPRKPRLPLPVQGALGFSVFVLALVLEATLPSSWERPWTDLVTRLRGWMMPTEKPHPALVLVAYDDEARAVRQGNSMPADELAHLLALLKEGGAGPVVVDVVWGSVEGKAIVESLSPVLQGGSVWFPRAGDLGPVGVQTFDATLTVESDGSLRRWNREGPVRPVLSSWPTAAVLGWRLPEMADPVFLSRRWTTLPWDQLLKAPVGDLRGLADTLVVVADVSSAGKDRLTTLEGPVWGAEALLWQLQTALSDHPMLRDPGRLARSIALLVPVILWMTWSFWRPARLRVNAAWVLAGATLLELGWGVAEGTLWPWLSWVLPLGAAWFVLASWEASTTRRRRRLAMVRDQRNRSQGAWNQTAAGLLHQMVGRAGMGVHLASRGSAPDEQIVLLLEGLRDQARQGLDLLRAPSGSGSPDPKSILSRVIDQARLDRPQVDFQLHIGDGLAPLPLDPLDAQLALEVFVTNAAEVSHQVRVEGGKKGNHSFLVIEDDGPGLPLRWGLPRLPPGTSTKAGGNGFGLWWAREVLAEAGIRIRFISSRQGTRIQWEWRK